MPYADQDVAQVAETGTGTQTSTNTEPVGGKVFARGRYPAGRQWRAGIEIPETSQAELQRVLALDDETLATSGDRVNNYLSGGRRYSHLINPRHSEPLDTAPASVPVHAMKVLLDNRVSDPSVVEMNGQLVGVLS